MILIQVLGNRIIPTLVCFLTLSAALSLDVSGKLIHELVGKAKSENLFTKVNASETSFKINDNKFPQRNDNIVVPTDLNNTLSDGSTVAPVTADHGTDQTAAYSSEQTEFVTTDRQEYSSTNDKFPGEQTTTPYPEYPTTSHGQYSTSSQTEIPTVSHSAYYTTSYSEPRTAVDTTEGSTSRTDVVSETTDSHTSTTSSPVKYTVIKGKFVDNSQIWQSELGDPTSALYQIQTKSYQFRLQQMLSDMRRRRGSTIPNVIISALSSVYLGQPEPNVMVDYAIAAYDSDLESKVQQAIERCGWKIYVDPAPGPDPEHVIVDHSPGWTLAGGMLRETMDLSADPCNDFFQYTCGNYNTTHPLTHESIVSTFDDLRSEVYRNLSAALNNLTVTNQTSQSVLTLAQIYVGCTKASSGDYSTEILRFTDDYGGWPLLKEDWDGSLVNIFELVGDIYAKHGVSTLFSPDVSVDWRQPSDNILFVDQANLVISAIYYQTPELTAEYLEKLNRTIYDYIYDLTAGRSLPDAEKLRRDVEMMINIELTLANFSIKAEDRRNQTRLYNRFQLDDQMQSPPGRNIDWKQYLTSVTRLVDVTLSQKPFVVMSLDYTEKLDDWLSHVLSTPALKRDLVNYLMFRLTYQYAQFVSKDSKFIRSNIKATKGREMETESDDGEDCAEQLMNMLGYAVGRVYLDSLSNIVQIKEAVSVMVSNVLSAMHGSMTGLHWMDDVSMFFASDKINQLVQNVVYPEMLLDDRQLDKYHAWLFSEIFRTLPNNYFEYYQLLLQFKVHTSLTSLDEPADRYDFGRSPAVVNAWYQGDRNSITIPMAILSPPFYRYDFPKAVNYGGVGVVIGHELSHGLDDKGVQYNAYGKLETWMSSSSKENFEKIAQCVIDEYGNFCYNDLGYCINGVTTQGENIGDNGGIKAAYRAYQLYQDSNGPEARLPGLEFLSAEQVFFVTFGRVWCSQYSSEALRKQLLTNPHSPGQYRVLGTLRNFPMFGEAFKCAKGQDFMYPNQPCDVW